MKNAKVEISVANLCDEEKYVRHIRNLKQVSNHKLVLEKVHRIIKFNTNIWLNQYMIYTQI